MIEKRKLWVLLAAGVAVVAIVVLSASFRDVELSQGEFIPRYKEAEVIFYTPDEPLNVPFLGHLYQGLYLLTVLLLPLSIVYLLLSPEARKYVLRGLGLLMWLVALFVLLRMRPEVFEQLDQQGQQGERVTKALLREVQFVADPPQWAVLGLTLIVALAVAAGLVWAVLYVWRRTRPHASPLELLAQEAQDALDALHAGADFEDTVLRCYFEMSRVVREQRGILREEAMTTREFQVSLEQAGLPREQVRQLTRLFEDVRYGAKAAGWRQERQAADCLTAIAAACRSAS